MLSMVYKYITVGNIISTYPKMHVMIFIVSSPFYTVSGKLIFKFQKDKDNRQNNTGGYSGDAVSHKVSKYRNPFIPWPL